MSCKCMSGYVQELKFPIFERRLKVKCLLLLNTYIGVNFLWLYVSSSVMWLDFFVVALFFLCAFFCVFDLTNESLINKGKYLLS